MKTRQIHGLGLGEFLIFAPAKEMLKSAYFFSALAFVRELFFRKFAFNYAAVIIYILIRVKNPVVFHMLRGGIKRCVSAMHLL